MLAARFGGLQAKLDQLLVQLEDEKYHRTNLHSLNEKLETKIDFLMSRSTKQEEEIRFLKNINCVDNIIQPKPRKNSIIIHYHPSYPLPLVGNYQPSVII